MSIKQDIINESFKKDEEICGFIIYDADKASLYPIQNRADDKENSFVIPAKEYLYIEKKFKILAVYHSHIYGGPEPSDLDKLTAEAISYPFVIYSKDTNSFEIYEPPLSKIKKDEVLKIL